MTRLLVHTAATECDEFHLMLTIGFFTGARVGTIVTLTAGSLRAAREDPNAPGIYLLAVGPGTGINTKFSVRGNIRVPRAVLKDLCQYAESPRRTFRKMKAREDDKDLLFLNRRGEPYTPDSVGGLTRQMRKAAVKSGLQFMSNFKFHQSRATFGTWLMTLLLDSGISAGVAIREVRDAMLHADEKTTFLYITFLETTRGKELAADAFSQAFTGILRSIGSGRG